MDIVPFTSALARTIRKPDLGIFDAINEVGLAVKVATGEHNSRGSRLLQ